MKVFTIIYSTCFKEGPHDKDHGRIGTALVQRSPLKSSRFTAAIVRENSLDKRDFKEWVFCPGMLFGSGQKWWGDKGNRGRAHEGLDLLLYRNNDGEVLSLDEKTAVPAIYDGTVVRVIDDFLGRSIFMKHHAHGNSRFITAFGHTKPLAGIEAGSRVKEGDIIATIAGTSDPKINIAPHLHISAGWISAEIDYETLDWETIGSSKMIRLIDPLKIIGGGSQDT